MCDPETGCILAFAMDGSRVLGDVVQYTLSRVPPCPTMSLANQGDESEIVGVASVDLGVFGSRPVLWFFLEFSYSRTILAGLSAACLCRSKFMPDVTAKSSAHGLPPGPLGSQMSAGLLFLSLPSWTLIPSSLGLLGNKLVFSFSA